LKDKIIFLVERERNQDFVAHLSDEPEIKARGKTSDEAVVNLIRARSDLFTIDVRLI
jgi:predicted RNase H-like HicB family nuclease